MALSYHQKMAISWTDWGCGLASAPALGPGSFLVGGAASMALYHIFMADRSRSRSAASAQSRSQIESDDWGEMHNALCSNYLDQGFREVKYEDVVNVACEVKPELEKELRGISEDTYNSYVLKALCANLTTPEDQLEFTRRIISLDENDANTVIDIYRQLHETEEPNEWFERVSSLINMIADFKLSEEDKYNYSKSLEILRASFGLWNERG